MLRWFFKQVARWLKWTVEINIEMLLIERFGLSYGPPECEDCHIEERRLKIRKPATPMTLLVELDIKLCDGCKGLAQQHHRDMLDYVHDMSTLPKAVVNERWTEPPIGGKG